jgi:hypothetical protein
MGFRKTNEPQSLAEEGMAFAKESMQQRVTPGVKTEIIWPEGEARTPQDLREILEFWLAAEGIDLWDTNLYRPGPANPDPTEFSNLATFLYDNTAFNAVCFPNAIFPHSMVLSLVAYAMTAPDRDPGLLASFQPILQLGKFSLLASEDSPTGFFVHHTVDIFAEPKSVQFAIGTAVNLSTAICSQLVPTWVEQFGGEALILESLSDLID